MAAVKQPQLGELIGRDIAHQGGAGRVPGRALAPEFVLDHPLGEGLGHDRPSVGQSERRGGAGPIGLRGGRHDAVHHGGGAAQLAREITAEIGVAEGREAREHAAQRPPVMGEVVAAERRERCEARGPSPPQGLHNEAGCGAGGLGIGEVVPYVWMRFVEFARGGPVAIALLGHGQRYDARVRRHHGVQQGFRILGRDDEARHAADDLQPLARGVPHRETIKAILRRQGIARVGVPQRRAQNAPAPVTRAEHGVRIDGLMGAVKRADAEMHDSGRDSRAIVGRADHRARQAVERGSAEARVTGHSGAPDQCAAWLLARATIWVGLTKRNASRSQTSVVTI